MIRLLLFTAFCAAGGFPAFSFSAGPTGDMVARGDSLAALFRNDLAVKMYEAAYKLNPHDCLVLWKLAEAHVNLGEDATAAKRREHYTRAEKWAKETVARCPEEKNGYFFIAVTGGLLALEESGKQRVRRSFQVREAALRTIALDPEHHGAYHVLARWHREVAKLTWIEKIAAKIIYGGVPPAASNEEAVRLFKKALAISPNWINHHKELAMTYMVMKDWQAARDELEAVISLPATDHEDEFHKQQARRLLDEVKRNL